MSALSRSLTSGPAPLTRTPSAFVPMPLCRTMTLSHDPVPRPQDQPFADEEEVVRDDAPSFSSPLRRAPSASIEERLESEAARYSWTPEQIAEGLQRERAAVLTWDREAAERERRTARTIEVVAAARSEILRNAIAAERSKATAKMVQEWAVIEKEVEAESAEQDARDRRRLARAEPTEADSEFNAWFKVYAILENKASLTISEREKFREGSSIKSIKEGIAFCEEIIAARQAMASFTDAAPARDGTSPNISAQGGEIE